MLLRRLLLWALVLIPITLGGCATPGPVPGDSIPCDPDAFIEAIRDANSTPSSTDSLQLTTNCIYQYSEPYANNPPYTYSALPIITSPVEINGNDAFLSIVATNEDPALRGFSVSPSGSLTINNLTMTALGYSDIPDLDALREGGMIHNRGHLVINDSVIDKGIARDGAAIWNGGSLEINRSEFTNGYSTHWGAAILDWESAALVIRNSKFINNNALYGGAVFSSRMYGTVSILNSIFSDNYAIYDGGSLYVKGDLSVEGSLFRLNEADRGGAIFQAEGNMNISSTRFVSNKGCEGSAVRMGVSPSSKEVVINNSEFVRNWIPDCRAYDDGGVIHLVGAHTQVTLENSTVSRNGAGYAVYGQAPLTIQFSTIAYNTSAVGISSPMVSGITIKNSIIANNQQDCDIPFGSFAVDANIDSDGSCRGFTLTDNPMLDALGDNGGPTKTHALKAGSPAIDAAQGSCLDQDQRFEPRPLGGACDLGAVEIDPSMVSALGDDLPPVIVSTEESDQDDGGDGPPGQGPCTARVITAAVCKKGPGGGYDAVGSVNANGLVEVIGQSQSGEYAVIMHPCFPTVPCWLEKSHLVLFCTDESLPQWSAPPVKEPDGEDDSGSIKPTKTPCPPGMPC